MVAHSYHAAATEEDETQRRSGRFHHLQSSSPRRRTKRGQLSRGVNRAGVTTKFHLAGTPELHVIEGLLTGGNISDITVADELTAEVVGCYVVEDMGYDSDL